MNKMALIKATLGTIASVLVLVLFFYLIIVSPVLFVLLLVVISGAGILGAIFSIFYAMFDE